MERTRLVEVKEEATNKRGDNLSKLSTLVERWGKNKVVLDPLKKEVDKDAAEIKKIMLEEELDTSISGDYTASLTFKTTESFDEDALLTYIKSALVGKDGKCPYINLVEVVNWEEIEKAIFNGTITKEQVLEIDKFKTVKKTPTLNFVKPKKEG